MRVACRVRILGAGLLGWLSLAAFACAGANAATVAPVSWQSPVPIGHGSPLTGISCPTSSMCVAVDEAGEVISSTDPRGGSAAWNAVALTPALLVGNLVGVSCATTTMCVAIDANTGQAFSTADPTGGAAAWQATTIEPQQLGGGPVAVLQSVSCPSASLCVAVDDAGDVFTTTDPLGGGPWQMASVNEGNQLDGVWCPSAALCVAVGVGFATSTDPSGGASAWRSTSALGAQTVSCAGSHLCVAVDGNGNGYVTTDPTGGPQAWRQQVAIDRVFPFSPLTGISCPATSLCVAVNASGDAVSSTDPTAGAWASQAIDSASGLAAVSCPDVTTCLAADGAGDVVVGTGVARTAVALPSATVPVRRGRAGLRIACAGSRACHGTITLSLRLRAHIRRHGHRIAMTRTITLAATRYTVAGGHARTVALRLRAGGLRRLRRAHGHRLRVIAHARVRGGRTVQRRVTLHLR
ncbi:MAG TPA: hypothetical protein VFN65_10675 [Solirubrobacteraceae bacterium]|nr:hypothetical protein [Solirubrobacteraceae bacterium]